MSPASAADRFGQALGAVHAELDWELLGGLYCHEGGEDFFGDADREALLDAGLRLAGELGELLAQVRGQVGRSLYLGAAVAELPLLLFEHLVVERKLAWTLLPGPEAQELDRALTAVSGRLGLDLPRPRQSAVVPGGRIDLLWCASVLTDPIAFPGLHDELYRRRGTELAAGGGNVPAERRAAAELTDAATAELHPPALLVTSEEELPFFVRALEPRGLELVVPPAGRTSPIVGDVLRFCRVRRLKKRPRGVPAPAVRRHRRRPS